MTTLTNKQWTIAFLAIWFVVFLVLWPIWEMSGRDFHWWTTASYAAVVGVAAYVSLKITPSLQSRAIAPDNTDQKNWKLFLLALVCMALLIVLGLVVTYVLWPTTP